MNTRQKQPPIDAKNAEIIRQALAQTEYPVGDAVIKNPADYFQEAPDKRGPFDPRANPTSIPLSSRCHPQEVGEHSIVQLYDKSKTLGYNTLTMLKCRDHSLIARQNGDYERACILNSRTIGLILDISTHPDYSTRFKAEYIEYLDKVRQVAIQDAAGLSRVINARFFARADRAKRAENPEPVPPERSLHDVWLDLGRSWRAVKSSITKPPSTPPNLVVQNLQMEEESASPRTPAVVTQPSQRGQIQAPVSGATYSRPASRTSNHSRPASRMSNHGRRSSISKFDKDLPPPPKQAEAEGYSFNVEYTESPSSTAPHHSWRESTGEDDLPTYADVLLEAYADDPNPSPLVLALRSGQVTDENLGLLSGRNSSMTSLLDSLSTGGTQFHSANSTLPPSREGNGLQSSRAGLSSKPSSEKMSDKGDQKGRYPQEKQRSLSEKEKAELAESQRQFQRDLDAALRQLRKIATKRGSLPEDEQEVFNDETKSAVKMMNDLVNP